MAVRLTSRNAATVLKLPQLIHTSQRQLIDIPKTENIVSKSDNIISKSSEKVSSFASSMCKNDGVIRTFKQIRADFDHMSPTSRGFFVISTGLAGYFVTQLIGIIPLSLMTGSYLSYKYVKHTGQLDEWTRKLKGGN